MSKKTIDRILATIAVISAVICLIVAVRVSSVIYHPITPDAETVTEVQEAYDIEYRVRYNFVVNAPECEALVPPNAPLTLELLTSIWDSPPCALAREQLIREIRAAEAQR